ncbi:hypothetical protein [Blastococcus sp. SYSU D00820]
MAARARSVAVLPLLLVAACSATVDGAAAPAAHGSAPAGGPVEEVVLTYPVTAEFGDEVEVRAVTARSDGEAVLVLADGSGTSVATVSDAAEGWSQVEVEELSGFSDAAATADGAVLLAGGVEAGGDTGVGWVAVAADGGTTPVVVDADIDVQYRNEVQVAVSPDGRTVYLSISGDAPHLYAVDADSGEVTADAPLEIGGEVETALVTSLVVTPDGDPVAGLFTESGDAVLVRAGADLGSPAEVPLVADGEDGSDVHLATTADGTVLAAVGLRGTDGLEVRLLAVPDGAGTAELVAAWAGAYDVRGLAVDPAGTWAHVGLAEDPAAGEALTVTPVDLAAGAPGEPVVLCAEGVVGHGDVVLTPDATRLVVGGHCDDRADDEQVAWLLE